MKFNSTDHSLQILVDENELTLISQILNEICNGIHIPQFEKIFNTSEENVDFLLEEIIRTLKEYELSKITS